MPKFIISVTAETYADFTIEADTVERATELATEAFYAHVVDGTFQSLTAAQEGRIVLDDEGILRGPKVADTTFADDEDDKALTRCDNCAPCADGEHATVEPDENGIERCTCCGIETD